MIHLKISSETIDEVENHLAVVLVCEDIRPLKGQAGRVDWRLNGFLSELILKQRFQGVRGEALLMPLHGRLPAKELLVLGLGPFAAIHDQSYPDLAMMIVEKLLLKKESSFCLCLSDLAPVLFDWRQMVRFFMSRFSGCAENYQICLFEPPEYVEDARRRNMDFAYDVQVQYR